MAPEPEPGSGSEEPENGIEECESFLRDVNYGPAVVVPKVKGGSKFVQEFHPLKFNAVNKIEDMESEKRPESRNFVVKFVQSKLKTLTKRQISIVIIFGVVDLLAAAVVSIQAPFYPEVAGSKGASAVEYGSVFGIFELTAIVACTVFGYNMSSLKPQRLFIIGIIVTGVSSIVFGTLDKIEDGPTFIASCLVVRVIEAIGESAYITASFTIIALNFPDAVATSFAILETCYGLGMILGPTFGSFLYELGGYSLPFMLLGGLLLSSAIPTCFILPTDSKNAKGSKLITSSVSPAILSLMKLPVILMNSVGIVATATGIGYLCSLLEPHLRQFHLSKTTIGLVFILTGGVYAITAPLWGWLCDNIKNPKWVMLFGGISGILGFVLIGPLPFLPFETNLWMTCTGLVLVGLGMGSVYVSSFVIYLGDAIKHGFADDISTYGIVSGIWTAMVSFGYFLGPTFGGLLFDYYGFRWSSLFVLATQLVFVGILSLYLITVTEETPSKLKSDHVSGADFGENSNEAIKSGQPFLDILDE